MAKQEIRGRGRPPKQKIPELPKLPPLPSLGKREPGYDYIYASNDDGKTVKRFRRISWDQMGGNKSGFKEVAITPPEVLALHSEPQNPESEESENDES